jgi:hypothetical protein
VVDDVLNPAEVRVALGWKAVLPADVVVRAIPVTDVEGEIGEDVVGLEVPVEIAAKGVRRFRAEVALNAADGEVHDGELPGGGIALLPVDGDVAHAPAVSFDEAFALHEEATGAVARVIDAAFVGGDHLDQDFVHALRGVKLAASFAFGAGELAEEVFVDAPEDIFRAVRFVT